MSAASHDSLDVIRLLCTRSANNAFSPACAPLHESPTSISLTSCASPTSTTDQIYIYHSIIVRYIIFAMRWAMSVVLVLCGSRVWFYRAMMLRAVGFVSLTTHLLWQIHLLHQWRGPNSTAMFRIHQNLEQYLNVKCPSPILWSDPYYKSLWVYIFGIYRCLLLNHATTTEYIDLAEG